MPCHKTWSRTLLGLHPMGSPHSLFYST
uniref:Uncharacterized protein n=1 Tax=Rhizophora mucronata TaxID=61149 RepID=A0A2P2LWG8_RHIMU